MKLPNRDRAVIDHHKLKDYLLNPAHKRGGPKARLLGLFGFTVDNWEALEAEIRRNLENEVDVTRTTDYGLRYEVPMLLNTPEGRTLTMRSVWQIDEGSDVPRFITMYPGKDNE